MPTNSVAMEDHLLPADVGAADDIEPDDNAAAAAFVGAAVQDEEGTDLSAGTGGAAPAEDDADEGSPKARP